MTICPKCNLRPRRAIGAYCRPCDTIRGRELRAKNIAEGKPCARCKLKPRNNNSYCASCSTAVANAYKQRMISAGKLCNKCGVNKCNSTGTVCQGCQKINRKQKPEVHALWRARKQAKAMGRDFNLEVTDIVIPTHCPVLGIPLVLSDDYVKDDSPSLDRIDPSKGYIKGNVWIISQRANRIKNDSTLDELRMLVAALEKLNG